MEMNDESNHWGQVCYSRLRAIERVTKPYQDTQNIMRFWLEPEINLNTLITIYNTIYSGIMVVRLHRTEPYRLMIHGATFLSNVAWALSNWEWGTNFYLDTLDRSWALCLSWLPVDRNIDQSCFAKLPKKLPLYHQPYIFCGKCQALVSNNWYDIIFTSHNLKELNMSLPLESQRKMASLNQSWAAWSSVFNWITL